MGVIAIGAVIAVVIGAPVTIGVTVAHLTAHTASAGIWPALPGREGNTFQCDPAGQRGHIRFPILFIIAGNDGQNFLVVIGKTVFPLQDDVTVFITVTVSPLPVLGHLLIHIGIPGFVHKRYGLADQGCVLGEKRGEGYREQRNDRLQTGDQQKDDRKHHRHDGDDDFAGPLIGQFLRDENRNLGRHQMPPLSPNNSASKGSVPTSM